MFATPNASASRSSPSSPCSAGLGAPLLREEGAPPSSSLAAIGLRLAALRPPPFDAPLARRRRGVRGSPPSPTSPLRTPPSGLMEVPTTPTAPWPPAPARRFLFTFRRRGVCGDSEGAGLSTGVRTPTPDGCCAHSAFAAAAVVVAVVGEPAPFPLPLPADVRRPKPPPAPLPMGLPIVATSFSAVPPSLSSPSSTFVSSGQCGPFGGRPSLARRSLSILRMSASSASRTAAPCFFRWARSCRVAVCMSLATKAWMRTTYATMERMDMGMT